MDRVYNASVGHKTVKYNKKKIDYTRFHDEKYNMVSARMVTVDFQRGRIPFTG